MIGVEWLFLLFLLQDLIEDYLLNLFVFFRLPEVLIFAFFFIKLLLGKVSLLNCLAKLINGQISMPILCILKSFCGDLLVGLIVVLNNINGVLNCLS